MPESHKDSVHDISLHKKGEFGTGCPCRYPLAATSHEENARRVPSRFAGQYHGDARVIVGDHRAVMDLDKDAFDIRLLTDLETHICEAKRAKSQLALSDSRLPNVKVDRLETLFGGDQPLMRYTKVTQVCLPSGSCKEGASFAQAYRNLEAPPQAACTG